MTTRRPDIQLIALDLDGTLLDSNGRISSANRHAIQQATAQGVQVILATGKTRWSAEGVLAELGLQTPGVFCQGLTICAADGAILHETTLEPDTAVAILHHLHQAQLPYVAYCRDALRTPTDHYYRHMLHHKFGEPLPQLAPINPSQHPITKLLVSDETNNDATRAALTARFDRQVVVTQAVPEFLELLPLYTSKGQGLRWLLAHLGIAPAHVLAVGDGENDLEMLQLAGIGVAMGNAHPHIQAVADAVVATHDQSGVAEAITRFVL